MDVEMMSLGSAIFYPTRGVLWSHWFSWATFYYCLCLYYYHCQYYHYYYDRPTSTPVVVDGNRGMRYSHSQGNASPPRHRRPSRRRWLGMAACGPNLPSRVGVSALCHPRRGGGRGAQPIAWRHHDRGCRFGAWRHHDREGRRHRARINKNNKKTKTKKWKNKQIRKA